MAVFRKFKSLNIKYSYLDPQKALPYPERLFWHILRKNPLLKNQKNEEKTSHPKCTAKSRVCGAETPETDR